MASEREIDRIRKDAEAGRRICRQLLAGSSSVLTDSAESFLTSIESRTYLRELSTRQAEVVLEIRDELQIVSTTREGCSVSRLLRRCHELKAYFADDNDREWIEEIYLISSASIRKRDVGRLMNLDHQLDQLG
jgi:hypothetical protein